MRLHRMLTPPVVENGEPRPDNDLVPDEVASAWPKLMTVSSRLGEVILGKSNVIDAALVALLAEGSILLEDVPGVGKTTLAKSIATLIEMQYQRIQCTPDLLPADILGGAIYQPGLGTFEFRPGPVFCNLLVADEVNRASPRTQSALLEAMAESQVTIDSMRHPLKRPFMVIATQNPEGFEGTFPLPESQLDRFLLRTSLEYPDTESEIAILLQQAQDDPVDKLSPVMTGNELMILQKWVRSIRVDPKIARYIVALVTVSRQDNRVRVGCSPRGSKMLLRAAQAHAVLRGRSFVLPDDVQAVAVGVISHRLALRQSSASSRDAVALVSQWITQVEVPL